MPSIAAHIPSVPASGIRRIYEIAAELDGVISLGVGEPDVAIAPHIAAAAKAAWDRDDTNYNPNGGILPLRRAIIDKLAAENGIAAEGEQVWVTSGGTQAVHLAMQLLLAAGDEVLIPDPGYTIFAMVTPRTRVLIVNSPSNPLGAVFPREVLEELLSFARRHDLWILSDEVYERFVWGQPHVSLAAIETDGTSNAGGGIERVFSVFSFSKTYAMTGIRVGYLVTPPGLAATMRTLQEASISCVAMPDQFAALAAIQGEQSHVAAAAAHYRANYVAASAALTARGIHYLEPTGAFYLWVDVSHASNGDVAAWSEQFLLHERVAVAPGSAFGCSGEGWIRLCLAATQADLLAGIAKLPAP